MSDQQPVPSDPDAPRPDEAGAPRTDAPAAGPAGRNLTPGQVGLLNLRCLAVLAGGNGVLALVGVALGSGSGGDDTGAVLYILGLALLIAAGVVAVVGFPAGLLVARLLRGRGDGAHLLAYAVTGAVLAPLLVALVGWTSPGVLGAFALEGLAGAGGGAAWTLHRLRRPRPPRVPRTVPDELVEDAEADWLRAARQD
ncbi:hypothetical protein [Cellulomonas massiliensis]|uniref:hypothetical protein n=1 Tax=Cellulomonas massiliensis TaxID=1465811 RepID=UPI00030313C6|nr:hypothetical protein [Cellulomonas massiliensis]